MKISDDQAQHRIPKIYLKQFSFLKNGRHFISALNIELRKAEILSIEDFSKEINIFDLPFEELNIRRHFENSLSKIENDYGVVISNLQNQQQLTQKNKATLYHFVPGVLCRSVPFRNMLNEWLRNEKSRDNFIREITMFSNNSELVNECLSIFNIPYQLNIVIGVLMNYLIKVLSTFNQIVIKDFGNSGWFTTDLPVLIDRNENYDFIIPLESEIYFPLSKDFCLFMFHDKSKRCANPLRNLKKNKINYIDKTTFEEISFKISRNLFKYLIFPIEINPDEWCDSEK